MTEAEWLSCDDPVRMLAVLQTRGSGRKLRLFAAHACRASPNLGAHENLEAAVDAAEGLADGVASDEELAGAGEAIDWGRWEMCESLNHLSLAVSVAVQRPPVRVSDAQEVVGHVALIHPLCSPNGREEDGYPRQCEILRELFPFRPVTFDSAWRTVTAVALANLMYDSRDFTPMPILADALQDAGCDCEDILKHCRDASAPHVRGCWVVDLVLGKA
jgi:hypothetical protein